MPNAALRNAATSANPVAISPSTVAPPANPATPIDANAKPTTWANFNGGTGSRSVTGPRRGATRFAKSSPYGLWRGPRSALIPDTAASPPRITAATGALMADTNSVSTSTAVVIQAANRGPRTSTSSVLVDMKMLLCWTSWLGNARLRPLRARRAQRQQQQKQPAVRHRSTARRLVSNCSRRANTTASLPNADVIKTNKPLKVPAPIAGPRPRAQ